MTQLARARLVDGDPAPARGAAAPGAGPAPGQRGRARRGVDAVLPGPGAGGGRRHATRRYGSWSGPARCSPGCGTCTGWPAPGTTRAGSPATSGPPRPGNLRNSGFARQLLVDARADFQRIGVAHGEAWTCLELAVDRRGQQPRTPRRWRCATRRRRCSPRTATGAARDWARFLRCTLLPYAVAGRHARWARRWPSRSWRSWPRPPHPARDRKLEDCAEAFAVMLERGVDLEDGWQAWRLGLVPDPPRPGGDGGAGATGRVRRPVRTAAAAATVRGPRRGARAVPRPAGHARGSTGPAPGAGCRVPGGRAGWRSGPRLLPASRRLGAFRGGLRSGPPRSSTRPMCRFIDFISRHTPRASSREDDEAENTGGDLVLVELLRRAGRGASVPLRSRYISGIVADAREEVVLGEGGIDERLRELVLLGRPDLPLDLHRHPEPAAVGVDLRGVRDQRLVADLEEVGARNVRGQRALVALELLPALQPLPVRRLQAAREQRLVQRDGARPVEALVVVELLRLSRPGRTRPPGTSRCPPRPRTPPSRSCGS